MTAKNGSRPGTDAVAGARMALGTFTVFPVRVERVDRSTAGWAMSWAPVLGALLGSVTGVVVAGGVWLGLSAPLAALLGGGAGALLTGGLHLDGLADLADGLGSGRPAEGALKVMRRSDIGPFGVITLVLVLGVQVLALGQLAEVSPIVVVTSAVVAGAVGRSAVTLACTRRVPSARVEGLGATVAGTVARPGASASVLLMAVLCVLPGAHSMGLTIMFVAAVSLALLVSWFLLRHAIRRLGGITGDVLGALSETATTTALLVAAGATAWV